MDIIGVSVETEVVPSLSSFHTVHMALLMKLTTLLTPRDLGSTRFIASSSEFLIKPIKQASPLLHGSGEGAYNTTMELPTGSELRSTVFFSCNPSPYARASCAVRTPLNVPYPMYICTQLAINDVSCQR